MSIEDDTPDSTMSNRLRHGLFMLLEKLLRWSIHPRLRASILRFFGARIGSNVRIHEVQLFNLRLGFRNLEIDDGVFIGPGCRLDLEGTIVIGARSTLSPGTTVLTHEDPGSQQGSRLLALFPARAATTTIGSDCWLGTNVVVLAGVTIGNLSVVGAGSVVTRDVPVRTLAAGVPATWKRFIDI
jgi:acetyltransferase-like isoleucine patch superfamily enzyme